MATWFECKVTYEKIGEDGLQKKTTEPYLVDALSFTDAETIICDKCRSDDVDLIPIHYYNIGDYVNFKKITLTFRCRKCRNEYTVDIHNR